MTESTISNHYTGSVKYMLNSTIGTSLAHQISVLNTHTHTKSAVWTSNAKQHLLEYYWFAKCCLLRVKHKTNCLGNVIEYKNNRLILKKIWNQYILVQAGKCIYLKNTRLKLLYVFRLPHFVQCPNSS